MTGAARDTEGCPVLPYLMNPGEAPALTYFERNDGFQQQRRPGPLDRPIGPAPAEVRCA